MVSRKNINYKMQQDAKCVPHYGIRKLSIGVASVLLGTVFYMQNGTVHADVNPSVSTGSDSVNVVNKDSGTSGSAGASNTPTGVGSVNSGVGSANSAGSIVSTGNTTDSTVANQASVSPVDGTTKHANNADLAASEPESAIPASQVNVGTDTSNAISSLPPASHHQSAATNEQANHETNNLQLQTVALNQRQPINTALTDEKAVNKVPNEQAVSGEPVNNEAWQNVPTNVTPGSNQVNSQNFDPSQLSFKDGNPVTVSSADGRYTLNWQPVITGNSGTESWNADRHTTLAVSANVQAGDVLQLAIGQNSTVRLDGDNLASSWGTLNVQQWKQSDPNDVYTTRTIFTYTFKKTGSLNFNIYLHSNTNGYSAVWDLTKYRGIPVSTWPITWTLNGVAQDNTGLSYKSVLFPNWNPDKTAKRAHQDDRILIGQTVRYNYNVNEDNGTVPRNPDSNLNYSTGSISSTLNYGAQIIIPMPKGFVLDPAASDHSAQVTMYQRADGAVVINVAKGGETESWNHGDGYKIVGHYDLAKQKHGFTETAAGPVTIAQKLDADGQLVKYYVSDQVYTEKFYGTDDTIPVHDLSNWINVPLNARGYHSTTDYIEYYQGLTNNSVFDFTNHSAVINYTYSHAAGVHAIRMAKINGVNNYTYTYTLFDGTTKSGTAAPGELIDAGVGNFIKSIEISPDTLLAGTTTPGAGNGTYDWHKHQVTTSEAACFEAYGNLQSTNDAGQVVRNGDSMPVKVQLTVSLNGNKYYFFNNAASVAMVGDQVAVWSNNYQKTSQLDGSGNYQNVAQIGLVGPRQIQEEPGSTTFELQDPVFYFVTKDKLVPNQASLDAFGAGRYHAGFKPRVTMKKLGDYVVTKLDFTGGGGFNMQNSGDFGAIQIMYDGAADLRGSVPYATFVYSPTININGGNVYNEATGKTGGNITNFDPAWIDADNLNRHLYDFGNQNFAFSLMVGGLSTVAMARGNGSVSMSGADSAADITKSNAMQFAVIVENMTTNSINNGDQFINLPSNFNLSGPVTYAGTDRLVITYALNDPVDLSQGSQVTGYHPKAVHYVTADQITDWSKVCSIRVHFAQLPASSLSGRILLDGSDPNFANDAHQKVTIQTGFYADNLKPYIDSKAASIEVTVPKHTVSYQFVDDDYDGAKVGSVTEVTGDYASQQAVNLVVPAGYDLAAGQPLPTTVTIGKTDILVPVHLVRATESVVVNFWDVHGNVVQSQTISGKYGMTKPVNDQLPDGWQLLNGQELPIKVVVGDQPKTLDYVIGHKVVFVDSASNLSAGSLIPGTQGKHYPVGLTTTDFRRTVKAIWQITMPDGSQQEQSQTFTFKRDALLDVVTGQVTYDHWSSNGQHVLAPAKLAPLNGYQITGNTALVVTPDSGDQTVKVTYRRLEPVMQLQYVTADGQLVGEKTDIVADSDGMVKLTAPVGYKLATISDRLKLAAGTFKITVIPDVQTYTTHDALPTNVTEPLTKTVTRTVKITMPNGHVRTVKQSVKFERTATVKADGTVSYSNWQAIGRAQFNKVFVPKRFGYHLTGHADQVAVTADMTDSVININYVKD